MFVVCNYETTSFLTGLCLTDSSCEFAQEKRGRTLLSKMTFKNFRIFVTSLIGILSLMCPLFSGAAIPTPVINPTVAFYYGAHPPLRDLQAFDIAVVEPDHVTEPRKQARAAADGVHELFAYVSLGEVQPSRKYYARLPAGSLRTDNPAWGSKVIDQNAPGWREFFLSQIIAPLWDQGWRGFFIDTLDSYQLFCTTDAERAQQTQALIGTLRELKQRYPQARLMLNRGFELLPEIASLVEAVAVESLYQGFDAGRSQYRPVPQADRDWLLAQMHTVHDRFHLPVISIEYVLPDKPSSRDIARATAAQVRAHGFVPWVANGGLNMLGVGNLEVLPRTVLILVDDLNHDVHDATAQRFLGMPLNYLGLRYEFIDLQTQALPDTVLSGRYAGVVSWLNAGAPHPGLAAWFQKRVAERIPIAVFDTFGFPVDQSAAAWLGLDVLAPTSPTHLAITARDATFVDFEMKAISDRALLQPIRLHAQTGRSLLQLQDQTGANYDAVGLTDWGGFALSPFATRTLPTLNQSRWILQPIKFLQAALRLEPMPMPDVTTEGGRRMVMAHIDGDGFASRAELPGSPFAASVMEKQFVARYRIPTAVSIIEGELSPSGVLGSLSTQLEPIARQLFALPNVEAASHSYSHPFDWVKSMQSLDSEKVGEVNKSYGLPLPRYRFNLQREIQGSIDYINTRLLPPNKKVTLFLWTGEADAPAAAIAQTTRSGVLNMNGGDTLITESNNSWTAVAAQGVRMGDEYQVNSPNQNENVYTNNWTGPFYGFDRVIETYKLTDKPHRFKPVDVYYHVYSASKPASILALHKVYDWVMAQPFTRVFPSQYAQKVLDFEATSIARDLLNGDLVVRSGQALRTLRMPDGAATPSIIGSTGIAGVTPGPSGDYLTLAAAAVRLSNLPDQKKGIRLAEINGTVSALERSVDATGERLQFTVTANESIAFTLAQATSCKVSADDRPVAAQVGTQRYRIVANDPASFIQRRRIVVRCPA